MKQRGIHWVLITLLVASPGLGLSFLPYFLRAVTLCEISPGQFENDEITYWHMTLTFSQVGWQGGYYTLNEVPARVGFSHFGPHGPWFPVLYGSLGRLIGWHLYSASVINSFLLSLALAIFVWLTQPGRRELVMTCLLVLTFWPVWLFITSNLQESLHHAGAIILAGMFYRTFSGTAVRAPFHLMTFCFLCVASLFRYTWSILFIPFFVFNLKRATWVAVSVAIGQAVLMMSVVFFTWQYFAAPYPRNVIAALSQSAASLDTLNLLTNNLIRNLNNLFIISPDTLLEVSQRYEVVIIVVYVSIYLWLNLRKGRSVGIRSRETASISFHSINLGLILILLLFFYDIRGGWRDYRVLAPHLLLSILLLSRGEMARVVWGVVVVNLVLTPFFIGIYQRNPYSYLKYDSSRLRIFQEQVRGFVSYSKHVNPWCNTLLIVGGVRDYTPELLSIPAGIGISAAFVEFDQISTSFKSRYILVGHGVDRKDVHQNEVRFLTNTIRGDLFLNLDCVCR